MTTTLGLSLTGRRVVFAGGGAVAARRVGRFLDEGALVTVVAPALGDAMRAHVDAGRVTWVARGIREADVTDAWFVHAATAVASVDAAVAAWCERARVFCVNASDGAHGTARLTAETRSGDVIVAVASDAGVDPRRSARLRDAIGAALRDGTLPLRRRRRAAGRVDLVGGGPGPADLMTIRGRRLLAEADVVVADRLGPIDVLSDLDPDVEIIDVGKAPGHHPVPQEEINALLVAHAKAGKRVVRLKGGDPFVFGRGGEEVAACLAAGIPVEVVPGLTSVVSVPQAAGIPVTHRGTAAGLHVTIGQGPVSPATRAALADATITTVVLMGVAALPKLVAAALGAGAPADRPVAIIERGHTPTQRTTRTTLANAVTDAASAGVSNPAVIVIGDVAAAGLLLPDAAVIAGSGDPSR
ncbi:uroporphyrinogen-III C-methyltransferase [Microbacterium sp. EYE_5]|uniref:uroporphyrinogen-III C-methyltransferase n=1 Tax=unclassified Microbacterium TaxID=2609290 RepID=UPI0020047232|nr:MULTISPECIES: uroporphyrinogen-III C-methyltransferase [unclassified Microbacterium]MCK6079434.1 uroporphyrinogen-III C-methyltransferase [Microbacterium sp. EYE_382]MCK6084704.1 uroporphyrinogen-III C-methyltransferase [Microbacterium sp. EYE_384]MCK6123067.1 uroporphyrinogen-III C-methyltransferase [Microbacterium sp. EYE_80]MCK6125468.1 uroporphyrinogen-III C-methyltransferase [Microbacterium sp. EYE_79]MCK6140388.1 uroporphyrinogen-III C-methyltransferase [Microbacterium sp. EYE_39]